MILESRKARGREECFVVLEDRTGSVEGFRLRYRPVEWLSTKEVATVLPK